MTTNSKTRRLKAGGWAAVAIGMGIGLLRATAVLSAPALTNVTQVLANELASEGNHRAAAVEYRRLALSEIEPEPRAGYHWAAAYEYVQAKDYDLASKMLDRVDEDSRNLTAPTLLLRGETAIRSGKTEEAAFYYQSILKARPDALSTIGQTNFYFKAKAAAARRLAHTQVAAGAICQAQQSLASAPADNSVTLKALDGYARGHDKKPWLGGLLGVVPGLGYAYSGEYANALRSLILNGIFIYAMADTGHHEEWGAFSVITFFEMTWYTGSIYGGVDAAHRCNQERMDECLKVLDQASGFSPDLRQIPLVSLQFEF